ncbi:Urb2 domain-containing protein [Heracleum sosnowskyi]|uniref:Urb2 domain-containing protein n=1 Tax=Heracleum sosnowskyi TaxID=360622 RepID=A0AAD8GY94_9APIA|nr:Urb2 domain-containing protein [Heracleum sosnowskyi]
MGDLKKEQKKHKEMDKKRKNRSSDVEKEQLKAPRFEELENEQQQELEDSDSLKSDAPWSNLQLILSLQNNKIDTQRKVELAYDYVKSRVSEAESNGAEEKEAIRISRVVVFVSDWIQSLLISSGKRISVEGSKFELELCLDCRCWEIFRFCLDEAVKQKVSLGFSRDLLQVIQCIAGNVLFRLSVASSGIQVRDLELYNAVLCCISCIFVSHGGISNENLNLWVSTVGAVLNLVQKILQDKLDDSKIGVFVLNFSCVVIKPFSKYLKVHPTRRDNFNCFVKELLEPLLYMLDVLHPFTSDHGWKGNLWKLIKEVLSQGLFHPNHIDGFMSVQSLNKYTTSSDYQSIKDSKMVVKSYHRHFFDKLEKMMTGTNASTLGNVGELFRSYVDCIKKQKGLSSVGEGGSAQLQDEPYSQIAKVSSTNGSVGTENSHHASGLDSETRKLLFDFFIQLMEPFLGEIYTYLQDELEVGPILSTARCTLKSLNKLLVSFAHENVYVRTEDTSDGACLNFLKAIYDVIRSLSARIQHIFPSTIDSDERIHREVIVLIFKELIFTLKCFSEIEYEVFGDDLESLWLMMISHGASGLVLIDSPEQSLLTVEIIQFGIQLIRIYGDLRQVNSAVFTLCKAVRRLLSSVGDGQMCYSNVWKPSLYCESCVKFLGMLLCSHEFRLSICDAIMSIPEGQVSGFIQLFKTDVSESLVWMKGDCSTNARTKHGKLDSDNCSSPCFKIKAEVLGRSLSELYSLILDSVTATTGNSTLVGVALKDLIAEIRPNMRCLVERQLDLVEKQMDSVYVFLSTLTGRTITMGDECKHVCMSTHWVVLFFFRLYMSSKSLCRQAVSLLPPDISRKMSESMGDTLTAYSGSDLLKRTSGADEGYFSWIVQPSASLLSTINAVLHIFIQDSVADCSSLIYVFITMTIQRLVDLNRLIKSFKYLKRRVSALKHEAKELTNFLLEYIPEFDKIQLPISSANVNDCEMSVQRSPDKDGWDFSAGAVNKKSLSTATWWIICQNVDVWCAYPAKEKLKKFLSLLIRSSLPSSKNNFSVSEKHVTDKYGHLKKITAHQISSELLCNAVLYEQKFVRRHMASELCEIMEELVSSISVAEPNSCSSNNLHLVEVNIKDCQSLLKFLCWMPKGYIKSKTLSDYTNCIINLERLLQDSFIEISSALQPHECHELFRLFMLCRKTLNKLTMASEERMEPSHFISTPIYHESLFQTKRLSMSLSAVIGLQDRFPDCASQSNGTIFSLMDHTSYMFLKFSRDQFMHAIKGLMNSVKPCEEITDTCLDNDSNLNKYDSCLESATDPDVWKTIVSHAESLKEQARTSLISLKQTLSGKDVTGFTVQDVELFSTTISCIQGVLWGLASALDELDEERCHLKSKLSKWKCEPFFRIRTCIDTFAEFFSYLLNFMFLEGHVDSLCLKESSSKGCGDDADYHEKQQNSHNAEGDSASKIKDKSKKRIKVRRKHEGVVSIFTKIDLFKQQYVKKSLLLGFLRGQNLEAAFLLRQLFIAYSAILRINLHIKNIFFSESLVPSLVSIAEVLLLEFANMAESPHEFCFVWLDGIAKFLEELGRQLYSADATLTKKLYVKLINIHLRALGKCIALQGKGATLASHETESSIKTLDDQTKLSESSYGQHSLNELKARLRMSFRVFVEKTSESHLSSAIQEIEKAVIGLQEGSRSNYEICTGNLGGGKISSTVAAGVDCFDLFLEYVKGNKYPVVVKEHIKNIVSALFNIILHLQGPNLFFGNTIPYSAEAPPDSGSVILMIIEVLTRVFGKHTLSQVDGCYVSQSLRISGGLFQNILQLKVSKANASNHMLIPDSTSSEILESMNTCAIDRQFMIELYAACCRLLCTVLKHYKSETQRCSALLEDAVHVLLCCLEMVEVDPSPAKDYLAWEVQEGIKCAYFLRRIYEELRQQKDVLGCCCFQLLSGYIRIYSGYGPCKMGIRRDIDEALRPGIYALIDACSADDLQRMHTVFGEGPCRSTLAALQHDYKLNFQYEGKV